MSAPTVQASWVQASDNASPTLYFNWQNGNGEKRAVFWGRGSYPDFASFPAVGTEFQVGDQWSNWKCVYTGSDNFASYVEPTTGVPYTVFVVEYNIDKSTGKAYYNVDMDWRYYNYKIVWHSARDIVCDVPVNYREEIPSDPKDFILQIMGWVQDAQLFADTDTTTYSILTAKKASSDSSCGVRAYFSSSATDTITIKLGIGNLDDLPNYDNILISSGRDANVGQSSLNENNDVKSLTTLINNNQATIDGSNAYIKFVPGAACYNVRIGLKNSPIAKQSVVIYYVARIVAPPTLATDNTVGCMGDYIKLNATPSYNAGVRWTSDSGETSYSEDGGFYTPQLNRNRTFYAQSVHKASGCVSPVSVPFTVKALEKPVITLAPVNTTANIGDSTSFSIKATINDWTISGYDWKVIKTDGFYYNISDDATYSRSHTGQLIISKVTADMNGYQYICIPFSNCSRSSDPVTLTVRQPQTLTFTSQTAGSTVSAKYGDNAISATATSTSSLPIVYSSNNTSVASIDNAGKVTVNGVGTAMITVSQDGNDNFTTATPISLTLNIAPKAITVNVNAQTKIYGTTDPALTYTSSGLINNDTLTGSLSRLPGENVGNYGITQGSVSAGNNYSITFNSNNLTINPTALTIIADPKSKSYGSQDPVLTFTATGLVRKDTVMGKLSRVPGENAGTYAITQGSISADNNYTINFTGSNLTITPVALTINTEEQSKVYGAPDPVLAYTVTGLVNNEIVTGSLTRMPGENIGEYAILQGTLSASSNYNVSFNSKNLKITPANLTITADAKTKVYGTVDPALTYTVSGLANNDKITGTLTRVAGENAGSYAITQGSVNASDNYNLVFNSNNLIITPTTVTVTADAKSKVYGTVDPAFTYTVSGLVNNDKITGTLTRVAGENAGSYAITQGSVKAGDNYNFVFNGNNLNIAPATLTVTADAKSKVYGTNDPILTYTATGLVGGDKISGTLSRNAGENVGSYTITQGSLSAGNNYNLTFNNNTLNITPAALQIIADAKLKVYGSNDPVLTYTTTGLISGDKIIGSLSRDAGENAGIYTISQGSINPSNNYTFNFTANTFTISKAPQSITWTQDLNIGCNGINTIQLNAATNSGLPVTYSIANNDIATLSGNSLTANTIGIVAVTATQDGDNNYEAAASVSKELKVMLPSAVRQQLNNLLIFDNSNNNYLTWQWYKNNISIPGATNAYFSDPTGLNGSYSVIATDKNGNNIQSCPIQVSAATARIAGIRVSPNPAIKGQSATLTCNFTEDALIGAMLYITDIRGNAIDQLKNVHPITTIQMPANSGFYIITLQMANGQKITTNVIVH